MRYHNHGADCKPERVRKMRITGILCISLLAFVLTGAYVVYAILPPCPVVTDNTIGLMAQNWASSLANPFTAYLQDKYSLLLKQKTAAGIWGQAEQIYGLYGKTDNLNSILEREVANTGSGGLDWLKRAAGLSDHRSAVSKMDNAALQATASIFSGGKNALQLAEETDALMKQFSPLQFDYASKSQVQKDMAKMARLQIRVQAEILWLTSAIKMQEVLTR